MINEHELFLEGHKQLIGIMKWISTPLIYVTKGSIDPATLQDIDFGSIIFGNKPTGQGMEVLHQFPKEDVTFILKTFCESHLRLK
jgi:hypothetical protein